jgi:hypothetical protein
MSTEQMTSKIFGVAQNRHNNARQSKIDEGVEWLSHFAINSQEDTIKPVSQK